MFDPYEINSLHNQTLPLSHSLSLKDRIDCPKLKPMSATYLSLLTHSHSFSFLLILKGIFIDPHTLLLT